MHGAIRRAKNNNYASNYYRQPHLRAKNNKKNYFYCLNKKKRTALLKVY